MINGATNTVTTTLNVGQFPEGVAVDPATDTVYVTNSGDDTMSVIDGANNTVTSTVTVGSDPYGVAVDESTDTVYVANSGVDTVTVITGATNTVTATVKISSSPEGVAVDETNDTVFTANPTDSGTVSEIDGATNMATTTIDVGSFPVSVATDDSTDTVDVANDNSDTLSTFSPTFATLPGAPTIGTAAAGHGQATVAFSAPSDNGGVAIKSYAVVATDLTNPARGGERAKGTTTPITVTGLTNGDSYTFTVTAKSFAPGSPSASSNAVTPTPLPKITRFSPASGPVGTVVTIKGTNLTGATKVTFNGTSATITSDTATTIKAKVPAKATTGAIQVTTPNGTVTSTSNFTVT